MEFVENEAQLARAIEGVWEDMNALLSEEKLYVAQKLAKKTVLAIQELVERLGEVASKAIDSFTSEPEYVDLMDRVEKIDLMLGMIYDDSDWITIRSDEHSKTFYRMDSASSTMTFKVEGLLDVSLFKLAAVLYEVDYFNTWFPFMKRSETIAVPSMYRKIGLTEQSIPWPFSNRDMVFNAFGVDDLDKHSFMIYLESLNSSDIYEIPAPVGSAVRCDLKVGGFHIQYVSPESTRVSGVFNVDPKLDFIPTSLINWVSGKIVHWFLYYIAKAAQFDLDDPTDVYTAAIKANPRFYDHIKGILDNVPEVRERTVTQ